MEWRLLLLELSASSSLTLPRHRALEVMLVFRLDISVNERARLPSAREERCLRPGKGGRGGRRVGRQGVAPFCLCCTGAAGGNDGEHK